MDIIIANCALIKQKKAKITCLCDFCFLCSFSFLYFLLFAIRCRLRSHFKTRASFFTGVSKHSKTIKALGLMASGCFISFLVFGNPGKTLTLVKYYVSYSILRALKRVFSIIVANPIKSLSLTASNLCLDLIKTLFFKHF